MHTACHRCREMESVELLNRYGVVCNRLVPDTGEGTVYREHMAVLERAPDIPTLAAWTRCEMCGGFGWLPGFIIPC